MAPHDKVVSICKTIPKNVVHILLNCDCVCFDVDSTMLTCEGIDEMARFAGKYEEVKALTVKAMGGNMSFRQCLTERLGIIQPTSKMIQNMVESKPPTMTPGFKDLVDALRNRGTEVYLVSGGFDCLIVPEAAKCGIAPNHVIANTILFDKEGKYAGFDKKNFTSENGGKARALQYLKDTFKFRKMIMIGDGMTDAEARPPADIFIGFGGNVKREAVKEVADYYTNSFYSILEALQSK